MQVILGIDNGLSGGLVALEASTGQIIAIAKMPCKQVGYKNEIDPNAVLNWILQFPEVTVAIEEPLHFAPTLASMRSMALSFGKIIGLCAAANIPCLRVQVNDWQNEILGKRLKKGLTKILALRKASLRWPKQKWTVGAGKIPHDGIIDAALIALYANENNVPEPVPPKRRAKTTRAKKVVVSSRRSP